MDVPCGGGKTSWAIQHMNSNEDESYIYCTPFIDEIDRIRERCGGYNRFAAPTYDNGTKLEGFNRLLAECRDIAVTHTTFLNSTPETLELLRTGDYTLIIDEVLDVVEDFNKIQSVEDVPRQKVTGDDIRFLLEHNIVQIENDYKVVWNDKDYGEDLKFSEVERLAKLGRLYCVNHIFLVAVFPPEIFNCFKNVYILTYMFGGSNFKQYLDLFNIEYELKSIQTEADGTRHVIDYSHEYDSAFRSLCKELICICDNWRMNGYRRGMLTKSWYDNSRKENFSKLKSDVGNFFNRYVKNASARNGDIMWTCYKSHRDKIKGKGYTHSRALTKDERRLPQNEREALEQNLSCFVPCNARATNKYGERWALAYCIDMRYHPMIRDFFISGNDCRARKGLPPIVPDEDLYSLSCLVQWVFRSRIRNGKPIVIYIPSKRMRELFINWLEDKI